MVDEIVKCPGFEEEYEISHFKSPEVISKKVSGLFGGLDKGLLLRSKDVEQRYFTSWSIVRFIYGMKRMSVK